MSRKSICTECGICCGNAVFSNVPCTPEEFLDIKERVPELKLRVLEVDCNRLDEIIENNEQRISIKFPCNALRDKQCSVYDIRPENCKKFECYLLQRYNRGEKTYDECMNEINELTRLIEERGVADSTVRRRIRISLYSKKPKKKTRV